MHLQLLMHLQDPIIFVTLSVDTKIVKSGGNVITSEASGLLPKNDTNQCFPVLENKARYTAAQLHADGQGLYLRSLYHLGRSSEAKDRKNPRKVKCDRRMDGRTDRRTDRRTDKAGCRVA